MTLRQLAVFVCACAVTVVAFWLASCASLEHIALPQSDPRCPAYGGTISVSLPDGRVSRSAGCIETAPWPGEPMPPRKS